MTVPESAGNGEVRITLKDLYLAQKQYEGKLADSDKRLSETFADLKLTLLGINNHLSTVDQRNAASDELHREHGRRLTEVERTLDTSGVRTMREERDSIVKRVEDRLHDLETKAASSDAVEDADREARSARTLARQTFWFAVAGMAAVVGLLITLLTLKVH